MNILDAILAALGALRVNLLRSVLTTLGIIIGVAAVIMMVSVGAGAHAQMDKLIASLGSNLLLVIPGTGVSGAVRLGTSTLPTLTEDDAKALATELDTVRLGCPIIQGKAQAVFGNLNWSTNVYGLTPDTIEAREWKIIAGRSFTPEDVTSASKVALLGKTVVEELFGDEQALGAEIRLKRVPFQVVGLLGPKGQTPVGRDQDDAIFIPITTARKRILGGRGLGGKAVSMIAIKVIDAESVSDCVAQVRSLLRQRHRLTPDQGDDFSIRNLAEFLEARAKSSRTMSMLLAVVASVALLVGGIGIMNIMLVSVTERTREIGIRMAVGAESRDILAQFLIEAVTLSLIGGAIGVVLGLSGSVSIASLGQWPVVIKPGSVFIAFGFSAAVGIFFGFYPARKASRMHPIEALRHE